jgi:hypothetical protein
LPKEGQLPIDEVAADISKKLDDDESTRTAVVASGEYAAVRQDDSQA